MISVNDAKNIIYQNITNLPAVSLPLKDACGLTLAEDVFAITDIPAFNQSSMDGYAFNFKDRNNHLTISFEMAAGATAQLSILHAEAARIFTGAPVPDGADTVVMQEKIELSDGKLIIKDQQLQQSGNVRLKGSEVKKGELAMHKNTHLSVPAIGFLAGIGITTVKIFPPPKVTIILTGNELQDPGKPLAFGQVYESSAISLSLALQQAGVKDICVLKSEDNPETLIRVLNEALLQSDMILLTGGVSVGDYDFVISASQVCGIQQQFHKITQKPGKPLFFGTKDDKIIFGLPGNPSSVLSCYYHYVLPAIGLILRKNTNMVTRKAMLSHDYKKAPGLTHFLKARINGDNVTPLHAQESFRLHSFAHADCMIELEESKGDYLAGDEVTIHILPI